MNQLIKEVEKQKIILPFHDNNMDFIINSKTDIDYIRQELLSSHSLDNKSLTDRQIECCRLLLNGKTAKETAGMLELSTRTVEYYLNNVKVKMNCKNKAELIAKLSGLISTSTWSVIDATTDKAILNDDSSYYKRVNIAWAIW